MKKIQKQLISLSFAVVMLLSVGLNASPAKAAEESPYCYNYVLYAKKDGTQDGEAVLDLYVEVRSKDGTNASTEEMTETPLDAGAFGLRFPEWLKGKVRFTVKDATTQLIVPQERQIPDADGAVWGDDYHAFSWTARNASDKYGTIDRKAVWKYNTAFGSYCLYIGQYTLDLGQNDAVKLPNKSDIGQLDWLTTDLAIPKEVGGTARDASDLFNLKIWNPETKLYQGYYEDPSADAEQGSPPVQTDIGFRFDPPKPWPSADASLTLVSYDPKKAVEIELYAWDRDTQSYGTEAAYTLTVQGESSGTDVCRQTIEFRGAVFKTASGGELSGAELPTNQYRMVIRKESHVRAELKGLTVRKTETVTELFPELEGEFLYLPCGDVNGDGEIRQEDRALLTAPGNYGKAAVEGQVYDLDGDDRVDQTDLAILIAPANYGKSDFTVVYPKETGR